MKEQIVFQPAPYGGRLKYLRARANPEYWDDLWEHSIQQQDYARQKKGHLPHQLRRTFVRWVSAPARVLEAGCGLGHFTIAANALGYRAEGVDWAPRVISALNERFPDVPFWLGDVRNLSNIPDATYDAVYSPGVCEHFEEGPGDVLRETYRILSVGGFAIISAPCFNAFRRLMHRVGAFSRSGEGEFYQFAFTSAELTTILEELGFRVVQVHPYGTLKTLTDHVSVMNWLPLRHLETPTAVALDTLPILRAWGHSSIWVARKL